jgi:predicted enzyme involved in methoxymalonyl-ACP biosynthesis
MSCRVIGRGLESAFIDTLLAFLKAKGYEYLTAQYITTPKNLQAADFYDRMGFAQAEGNSKEKKYRLRLSNHRSELKGNIDVKFDAN